MDSSDSCDYVFKILFVGDSGVGKSSILLRFINDSFDDHLVSTIGVDFKTKTMAVRGKRVKLTIWDTAGQERFRTLTTSYYRGAQGIIFTYDLCRKESFESLDRWLKEVERYSSQRGTHVVKVLVGNKKDMAQENRQVQRKDAISWARSKGMIFLESSAKTKEGIQQVFAEVLEKIMDDPLIYGPCATKRRGIGNTVSRLSSDQSSNEGQDDLCC